MKSNQQEIVQFLQQYFPQSLEKCEIEEVIEGGATMLWHVGGSDLRPGGTISGPTMMTLADFALYVAILGEIGIIGLAVTTNMTINFFRRPNGTQHIKAICRLIKVGKTLVTGEVWLYSIDNDERVAHVIGTYAIPQKS